MLSHEKTSSARNNGWFLLITATWGLLTGCANPSQPKPPSLHLPAKAQKPAAERVGDEVILTWTTPEKTTDKDPIRGAVTAVICRELPPTKSAPAGAPQCAPVAHKPVISGASRAVETLPPGLSSGAPRLLTYRIELQNAGGHSAGHSEAVLAAGGAAPPPTGTLTVTARREGAQIAWTKTSDPAPVRLVRTQISPAPVSRKADEANPQPMSFTGSKAQTAIVNLKTPDHLDADSGGVIDHTAQNGFAYSYIAERVDTVQLGGHTLELHSAMSPAATFTYRDVFPPKAPAGLVSVPGGGFGEAPSIDLSWDANSESDVLGYNVYRKDAGGGDYIRLNAAPIPASAFRDMTAEPGHSYLYRVTAVDQQHNESVPGDQIHETLRK